MKTINFALIGCGRIAKKYVEVFSANLVKKGRIIAVCDLDFTRAEEVANSLAVPAYSSIEALMAEQGKQLHAFLILTDSGSHAKLILNLVAFGKAIIVEKPLALSLEDADKIVAICKQESVRLFVVHQNRYNLSIQKLRAIYEQGCFGKIVMGSVRMRWCRTQEYYNQTSWHGTRQGEGGLFWNQAIHYLDLLVWFLGEPFSVFAKSKCALVKIETEDMGVAIITFKNGAVGVIEATTAARPCDIEGSFSLLGEQGMVEIDGIALNQIRHWRFLTPSLALPINLEDFSESPPNVYGFGHIPYLNLVVEELNGYSHRLPDGLEAVKSLKLAAAIYHSINKSKEIFL